MFCKTSNLLSLLFLPLLAGAETIQLQNYGYYLRNNSDFNSKTSKKVGFAPEGSNFEVIQRVKRANGSDGLLINISSAQKGVQLLNSKEYWIYDSSPQNNPDFKKQTDQTDLKISNKSEAVTSSTCKECEYTSTDAAAVLTKTNINNLSSTSREIELLFERTNSPVLPTNTAANPLPPTQVKIIEKIRQPASLSTSKK